METIDCCETGWVQTASGKKVFPMNPKPEDIEIEDIAHALSNICRFGGHCQSFYSVSQHSVLVSKCCDPRDALIGLLHDSPESLLVDLPRPIKHAMRKLGNTFFDDCEAKLMAAIAKRFGLPPEIPESVHAADLKLLVTEARDLMSPLHPDWHYCVENGYEALEERIVPWEPARAKREFLARFEEVL